MMPTQKLRHLFAGKKTVLSSLYRAIDLVNIFFLSLLLIREPEVCFLEKLQVDFTVLYPGINALLSAII